MANPIFPLNVYIPDGEAHVFDDRVYLYGSHDSADGKRFCMLDYVVYSASVNDLEHWDCHGVSYRKDQDPRSKDGKLVDFYAPDCVKGNDGRYYLYYFAAGPNTRPFGPLSVAVSSFPHGPFEYLGDIKNKDGSPLLTYLTNDPAVINDQGRIYLYYGWGLGRDFRNKFFSPLLRFVQSKLFRRSMKEIKATKPSILSCAVCELEDDMLTVKTAPEAVLDSKTTADKKSPLYHHAFYEAPSIRKFGEYYYLLYSTGTRHELAYAMSRYPDRGFEYKGVLISNADLGYLGNQQALAPAGTIHGSMEYMHGRYYVFYHRCTHNTDFSRQMCMEPLTMNEDGTFPQVEITSMGAGKPLPKGVYPAALCCNLYNEKIKSVQGNGHALDQPNIRAFGNSQYVSAISDGTVIGFKYFNFQNVSKLSLTLRGDPGTLAVGLQTTEMKEKVVFKACTTWQNLTLDFHPKNGIHPLFMVYEGKGKIDLLEIKLA